MQGIGAARVAPDQGGDVVDGTFTPVLRMATTGDVAALAALKRTTFRETFLEDFAIPYPPADIAVFEAETYGVARVAQELGDAEHATWVVEGADGALLAYAHVGPCKLPHGDVTPGEVELYQIYVRRSGQGLGLGKRLLAAVMAHLAGAPRVWLGVWSGNVKAQAFYAARGFRQVGGYQFAVGDWLDDEFIYRFDRA